LVSQQQVAVEATSDMFKVSLPLITVHPN
jgi:hypothetical protein